MLCQGKMNTERFKPSAIETDTLSVGFSAQEVATLLLKKFYWRANTGSDTSPINEPLYKQNIYPEQVVSDSIPQEPPNDFTTLTNSEIASQFNIGIDEISQFQTSIDGSSSFSIQRSVAYPHIYKINNCLLRPWPSNPSQTFTAITARSKINLLENSIPFAFGNGTYRGRFFRTTTAGELSKSGADYIKETQFAFVYDTDSGFFTCYEKDQNTCSPNNVGALNPPAVSCYIYKGSFGNLSPWKYVGTTDDIYYNAGQVLIGKTAPTSSNYVMDVSGMAFIDDLLVNSFTTFSDKRLKENIEFYRPNYDLLTLNAYKYNYISKPGNTEIGVIAQEMETVEPLLVKETDGYKSVHYDRIGVMLLPIIKEQQSTIVNLSCEVANLNQKLNLLIKKLMG
jgi:hypothetical protein